MVCNMSVYTQTTDFTCGPAALMMAMAGLDTAYIPSQLEEMLIWRVANLGFMGDGQAGCGVFGLGLAAMDRGFQAMVYGYETDGLFAFWTRNEAQRQVQCLLDDRDRDRFLQTGGQYQEKKADAALIASLLRTGPVIALITDEDDAAHWVLVKTIAGDAVTVTDPWPGRGGHTLPLSALQYGPRKSTALLLVAKP
jgi:predicted double-glycine peptidase